ncbi:hypothetical protein T10_10793 [Trichinella papuae]|uniref:Uncharacterized protein n=1 Tax=Trichinella papuae TaxID=268474 RepID=A0A0V1MWT1_9BILA|nr:hypothetical protein T10_10793 [Trichinella papuae]
MSGQGDNWKLLHTVSGRSCSSVGVNPPTCKSGHRPRKPLPFDLLSLISNLAWIVSFYGSLSIVKSDHFHTGQTFFSSPLIDPTCNNCSTQPWPAVVFVSLIPAKLLFYSRLLAGQMLSNEQLRCGHDPLMRTIQGGGRPGDATGRNDQWALSVVLAFVSDCFDATAHKLRRFN